MLAMKGSLPFKIETRRTELVGHTTWMRARSQNRSSTSLGCPYVGLAELVVSSLGASSAPARENQFTSRAPRPPSGDGIQGPDTPSLYQTFQASASATHAALCAVPARFADMGIGPATPRAAQWACVIGFTGQPGGPLLPYSGSRRTSDMNEKSSSLILRSAAS